MQPLYPAISNAGHAGKAAMQNAATIQTRETATSHSRLFMLRWINNLYLMN